ncbi:MAG: hypothetical protein KAT04_15315 [Methylococcales bacterium]|nr:hypothetical protein [Methylococcales bacterium]
MVLTTKQIIIILLISLIILVLYLPSSLGATVDDFYISAICLAAFLPVGSFQISRLKPELTLPLILAISMGIGALWFFIIQRIYPSSALIFSAMVSCGSYLVLRMK